MNGTAIENRSTESLQRTHVPTLLFPTSIRTGYAESLPLSEERSECETVSANHAPQVREPLVERDLTFIRLRTMTREEDGRELR